VAEPYSKPGWLSLVQWARLTKTPVSVPQIALPKFSVSEGMLVPDPALATDSAKSSGRAAWMAYETCRVKNAPIGGKSGFSVGADGSVTPMGSYHSLAQETECLRAILVDLRARIADGSVAEENLDPVLKVLSRLDNDGVLQCWILLNAADQGIRFDYPAYRKTNCDELIAYVNRYILQRTPSLSFSAPHKQGWCLRSTHDNVLYHASWPGRCRPFSIMLNLGKEHGAYLLMEPCLGPKSNPTHRRRSY
jgi:hypothetical protein